MSTQLADATGSDRRRWLLLLGWALVLLAGAGLRLWQLPDQVLFDDEWHALHKAIATGFRGILTSFGIADHSIPLTAYYHGIMRFDGELSEWKMRFPLLAAGVVMIAFIPWLMRPFTQPAERLLAGGLLAVSPLMIQFSRQARPYTLAVVLAWVALMAFWHWWHGRHRAWAAAYVACTALAAWLLPVTLAFTLSPFLYFGLQSLLTLYRDRAPGGLYRLTGLGLVTLVPLLVLLGPPVYYDFGALSSKAGVHTVTPLTAWVALELFMGASNALVAIVWIGLACLGGYLLVRRSAPLAAYFGFVTLAAGVVIMSTDAAWIHHALVLARYLLPLQPLLLALVAIGAWALLRRFPAPAGWTVATAAFAGLYLAGPLPAQYHQPVNQFTGHLAYQFDYDFSRSAYTVQMPRGPVPAFYRFLGELPPRSVTVVFTPWYLESHWNRLHYHQQAHAQNILIGLRAGYCIPQAFGEYAHDQYGVKMRNMVHLSELVSSPTPHRADYLVFHLDGPRENGGMLNEWLATRARIRPLANLDGCLAMLREDLGPPAFEDEATVVFRLNESAPVP
jgi:hypothetical protein